MTPVRRIASVEPTAGVWLTEQKSQERLFKARTVLCSFEQFPQKSPVFYQHVFKLSFLIHHVATKISAQTETIQTPQKEIPLCAATISV